MRFLAKEYLSVTNATTMSDTKAKLNTENSKKDKLL